MKLIGSSSIRPEVRTRGSLWRLCWRSSSLLAALTALAILLAWVLIFRRGPAPRVPIPANIGQLEPQLRDYVRETVQWVNEKSRSAERQATLGLVYAANGLWGEARLAFSNVVRLSPKEPLARLYLAVADQELGDLPAATQRLRELTTQFPGFAPGFYRLGEVSLRAGMVEEAEQAFHQLTNLAPTEWRGYAGLGDARIRKGEPGEAVKLLEQAIALDPEAKSAHHLLGLAYRALGRTNDAKLELSIGLNHVSYPMPDAWSEQAGRHMRLLQDQFDIAGEMAAAGSPRKAVDLLENARRYHPDHPGLLNNLAIAYNRSGDPSKARELLKPVLDNNDRYLPAQITLSYSCQLLGSNEEAIAVADRAIGLSTNTPQAYIAKSNALLGSERDEEALAVLETAARCDPRNPEIQVEMGDICWRNLNRPEAALQHYHVATNLEPGSPSAYVRLADYSLRQGDTNTAESLLSILRRVAPRCPEVPILEERLRRPATP